MKRDPIRDINLDRCAVAKDLHVSRAPPKTYENSCFQGAKVSVRTQDEIIPARDALFCDTRVASADKNTYAYRIDTPSGILEHFDDDGEPGAGRRVLQHLRDADITNQLVCVTRWYGGKHLGPIRFKYIEEAVTNVLKQ